jgi:hypothetical protein
MVDRKAADSEGRESCWCGLVEEGKFVGCHGWFCWLLVHAQKGLWPELRLKGEDEGKEKCFFFLFKVKRSEF